ncbi:MAG TPA: type II toxin-antitoxin system PrlF family antitoxin [Longimicrobiaceae bacterium]|nr:type II toxin-antitoxin system PrlF family antitoxin [Longimicrobiaceae bacterium]
MLYSTVTAKSQTTLPSGVRKALGVQPGDRLAYVIEGEQAVIRRAGDEEEADPVLGSFLDFIERQIDQHPERLQPMTAELRDRMRRVSEGVVVDLDEEIEGPVSL